MVCSDMVQCAHCENVACLLLFMAHIAILRWALNTTDDFSYCTMRKFLLTTVTRRGHNAENKLFYSIRVYVEFYE